MRNLVISLVTIFIVSCAGSGGGNSPARFTPVVTPVSTSYSGATQTVTFSDGSSQQYSASSSTVSWAPDHITKTTTYTFPDTTINVVVATIQPTLGLSAMPAIYSVNWTTTGSVIYPNISTYALTYGDGYSLTSTGLPNDPYSSELLYANGISDPNSAVFTASNQVYDLRWGTPDINGPLYASLFPSGSPAVYSSAFTMWGQTISGQGCASTCGATIAAPHADVIDAWNQGWTGKGVNILMEDWLGDSHGVTTTLLVNRYAKGATIYGFDVPTQSGIFNFDGSIASPLSNTNIGVVNLSYGASLEAIIGHASPWSDLELTSALVAYRPNATATISRYTRATTFANFDLTDAVISKSAGNDGINSDYAPLVNELAANPATQSRLLVVGALNASGFTHAPATITSYSNKAGTDLTVQSRFVVASGTTPFRTGDVANNGVAISATTSIDPNGVFLGNVGTSYAAPRVAGYVAIVRSKFPNLDAIKASNIMLDTARYDTLSCHYTAGGCNKAIYGQGEVSLSRALAPVGSLR